jgi:hypothetical protein
VYAIFFPVTCSLCFLELSGYFISFLISVTGVISKRVINSREKNQFFYAIPMVYMMNL